MAAATLSPESRSRSLRPSWLGQPLARICVDADDLAELADHHFRRDVDELDPRYLPILGVARMLMTPLPLRDCRRYMLTSLLAT
jgi:hypothetical protein